MENKTAKIKLGRFNITLYTDSNDNELFCIFNTVDGDMDISNSLTVEYSGSIKFIPFEHEYMPD